MAKVVCLLGVFLYLTSTCAQTGNEFLTFRGPCAFDADQGRGRKACPSRQTILLGGLFPLHSWTADRSYPLGGHCQGGIHPAGFQVMEAMRFAIEQVNAAEIIPGIQLAFEMRDSCFSPDLTRHHALRFINRGINSGDQCNTTTASSTAHPVSGVVGAPSSSSSIAAADLLGLFKVPQISYSSSSTTLSNKDRYRYFLRTLPPDNVKAQAIMALIKSLDANYFSLVYSTDSFGKAGAAEIRAAVSALESVNAYEDRVGTCIAADESIGANTADGSRSLYRKVLKKLVGEVGRSATVVVAFSGPVAFAEFLHELAVANESKENLPNNRLWIYSLSWATLDALSRGIPLSVARGALGLEVRSGSVKGFERHFRSLHPNNNTEPSFNPWLSEYWESVFKCNPDSADDLEREQCRENSLYNRSYNFRQSSFAPFVVDAVYAFAYGIRDMQEDKCGEGFRGICSAMLSSETARLGAVDGTTLLHHLLKVDFPSSAGHRVEFTSSGDLATAIYDIENLQVDEATGKAQFKLVGSWKRLPLGTRLGNSRRIVNGVLNLVECLPGEVSSQANCTLAELQLNMSAIQWQSGQFGMTHRPRSKCSAPCQAGHYAKSIGEPFPREFRRCCWRCEQCSQHFVTSTQFERCQRCPPHEHANNNQTGCIDISPDYWDIKDKQAMACAVLSVIGIVVTVIMAVVGTSVKHLLPQHSALHIGPLLLCLVGALGLFTSIFISTRKPTSTLCFVNNTLVSLSMTLLVTPFLAELVLQIQNSRRKNSEMDGNPNQSNVKGLEETYIAHNLHFLVAPRRACHLRGLILTADVVLLALAALSGSLKVEEDVNANTEIEIGCPTGLLYLSGVLFPLLISIATLYARFHCQMRSIKLHTTLSRTGYIIVVSLLISVAGFGVALFLSPLAKTSIRCFVQIAIAYAFIVTMLVPDLFLTLSPSESHSSSREHLSNLMHKSGRQRNSAKEAMANAVQTLQRQSLFTAVTCVSVRQETATQTLQVPP